MHFAISLCHDVFEIKLIMFKTNIKKYEIYMLIGTTLDSVSLCLSNTLIFMKHVKRYVVSSLTCA